ncbi:hypothetical protein PRZ48_012168 [Zasmidium cellare]|uniref:Uncharacterized protein n=1 Tax=Zasmidium cellare TaxID=395010 RepID=A0ABR0E446_ZASCE|nr:hypothetical protein PRZ48_012168 [Zasmidium cellare]
MASAFSSRCLRANLFHLPPALRTSIYANARPFSSTPPRKADPATTLTSLFVAAPTVVLDTVHSIGLPWCAAIPVTALLVRGVFGYYFAARPNRKRALAAYNLLPLVHARVKDDLYAWNSREIARQNANGLKTPPPGVRKMQDFINRTYYSFKERYVLGKAYGVPMLTWQNWFNIVIFIAFSEAVRIKCGAREGLLSLVLGPLQGKEMDTSGRPADPAEALAERIAAYRASQRDQSLSSEGIPDGNLLANQYQLPPMNTPAYADLADPTMRMEGFSWIQDLTIPDGTMILPVSLGLIMIFSSLLRPSVQKGMETVKDIQEKLKALDEPNNVTPQSQSMASIAKTTARQTPTTRTATNDVVRALKVAEQLNAELAAKNKKKTGSFFDTLSNTKRFGMLFAFVFTFIAAKLPAALVLYIISSACTSWLQGRFLDVKYPLRQPITPCKRPMRYKVKREWSDM